MTMKGGETTKRIGLVLFSVMILLAMFPVGSADAYPGGLLNGRPMIREDTGATVTTLTDGNTATYENLYDYDRKKAFVYYDFPEPMHITHYQVDINQTSYEALTFLDANNVVLASIGGTNLKQNIKTAVSIVGVAKVRIKSNSSNTVLLREMDVWGYPESVPPDTTPPAKPTGLTGTAGDKKVDLRWNSNSDSDLASYNIYRNGTLWGSVSTNTATITGLTNGTTYTFTISAVDRSGNESAQTAAISLEPKGPPPPDTTPPAVPVLQGKPGKEQAILTWTRSSDADFSYYNLYQDGEKSGNYTSNTATVSGLKNGKEYAFQVTAVDSSGNESAKSNRVTVIPVEKMDVNLIPNGDSIVVQIVSGGTGPYVINWGAAQKTVDQSQYVIPNLKFDTEYTVTITDSNGLTYTSKVNTGTEKGYVPPTFPNPQEAFQKMLNIFGTAGTIAVAIIGGAVALGLLVLLAYWGWLLLKRWLARTK